MEAVVLGGGGLTGRCAVRDLVASAVFERVRVADVDPDLARKAAVAAGGEPVATSTTADVRDPADLARVLTGAAVCVNAVQYRFNLDVMAGCLAAGVPYLDFGGLFHMTRRQLALDAKFREAGLLAVPGLGQVPGISNVLVAAGTADMHQVDSIVVRDAWTDLTQGGPETVFTWSPSTFLDEMLLPAVVWENGEYHEHPPLSEPQEYEFPTPIGKTRLYRTLHSEPATLPDSLASKHLRHCEWREGGPGIDLLRQLAQLGLGSEEPILVGGQPVVPRQLLLTLLKDRGLLGYPSGMNIVDVEMTDVEIRGSTAEGPATRHATAVFHSRPEWDATATQYGVGVAGSVGAILMAQGKAAGTGVIPPERAIPPQPFRAMLLERGVETRISPPDATFTDLIRRH